MINEESAQASLIASKLAYSYGPLGGQLPGYQWVAEISDVGTGFHAQVFKNGANEYVVAFTGTEAIFRDAYTDLNLGWTQWSRKREEVFQLLRDLKATGELASVTFTGHSLGGGIAQYAAYEYANELEPAPFSLTTFNAFGGVEGIRQKLNGYDSARLEGIDVNHFRAASDMVSRIGGAHVGGNVRVIDFPTPDFIAAHILDQSFLLPAYAGYQLTALPSVTPAYLSISNGQQIGAAMANLFARGTYSEVSAGLRVGAGLLVILKLAPAAEIDAIVDAMYPQYAQVNWGRVVSALPFSDGAAVLGGVGLVLAAGVYEGLQLGVDNLGEIKSFLRDVVGENFDAMTPLPIGEASLRMSLYLAATSGIGLAGSVLGQTLNSISINQSELTARLLSGANWLESSLDYLRGQAVSTGQNVADFSARLAQGIYQEALSFGETTATFLSGTLATLGGFLNNTAQGIGNAFSDLLNKVPGVLDLGRTLGFGEYQSYEQAYGQALQDRAIDSDLRSALKEAQDIVQRAGQTVVISKGMGVNPFSGQGFDPNAVPPATVSVNEGQWQTVSLYLPFEAGTGGQHVTLSLSGPHASAFVLRTTEGEVTQQNGGFAVVVPEGARQLTVHLWAKEPVSSASSLSLSAELTTSEGEATHVSDVEATIALTDVGTIPNGDVPAIDYFNGQQSVTWVGDSDNNTPFFNAGANHVVFGYGGYDVLDLSLSIALFNHQIFGGIGNDAVYGGEGQDRLYGDEGFDLLSGGGGRDVLYGGDTADRLLGDSADPTLVNSVPGDDYLDGGLGDDRLEGQAGNDTLYGGFGNDMLLGDDHAIYVNRPVGHDYLDGGEGDDYLFGGRGDDQLLGGAGDDYLRGDNKLNTDPDLLFVRVPGSMVLSQTTVSAFFGGAGGNDYLDGGAGNDKLMGDGGDDFLLGGEGNDRLYGDQDPDGIVGVIDGRDWVEGGEGNDFINGGGEEDALFGGAGDDTIWGDYTNETGFADYMDGGEGNDVLFGEQGDDVLLGGEDDDILHGREGDDDAAGGSGDDLIFGEDGEDVLDGEDGDDELQGGAGDDLVAGGTGNDILFGGDEDDSVLGEEGNDELQGNLGNDVLAGGDGTDTVFGQEGDDGLWGGDGNDTMWGGLGNDVLEGGAGDDGLVGDDTDLVGGVGGDDILQGGIGNDYLGGGGGRDTYLFNPGDGFDAIRDYSGEGNRLVFGAGINPTSVTVSATLDDSLVIRTGASGEGIEIYYFGTGSLGGLHPIDTFEFADGTILTYGELAAAGLGLSGGALDDVLLGTTLGDQVYGGPGSDTVQGQAGADSLFGEDGADVLEGGADNDVLSGGTGDDTLLGGTGADRLIGGSGADVLRGEEENDTLEGGPGVDTLEGGAGTDVLNGGADGDHLEGGAGDDTIIGGTGNDHLNGGDGSDTYRFSLGDGVDSAFDSGSSTDTDKVLFGAGIAVSSLRLVADSGQALVKVGAGPDGIYVGSTSDVLGSQTIEQFQFADGSLLTYAQLIATGFDIDGTEFDDFLTGTNVVDRFRGGAGNDRLEGGAGNDTYFFNVGDGVDTIVDVASAGAGNEVVFGAGITSADLLLDLASDQSDPSVKDLLIRVGTNGDAIQLDTFERNNVVGSRTVDTFRFSDGSTLTYEQLLARGFDLTGTDGDDQIGGTNVADRIVAGDGVDALRSGSGDDTLDGGAGNDQLVGGQGSDTYLFGPGSGQDTIIDSQGSLDTIRMAPGVAPSDVVATRNNHDLVLSLNGGADRLTVSLYFLAAPLQIERVQFADGTVWDQAFIDNLMQPAITGTGGPDSLIGTSGDDRLLGLSGDDQLTGFAGDDRLDGGTGADQLEGGVGDDTYIVDDAGDVVTEFVNEGHDTVLSAVSTQLSAHVENLTLTGNAAINGTGNDLENILTGNSAANVLTGGVGNDTYVIGTGDTVVEAANEGTDSVLSAISYQLSANVENLSLTGSASLIGTGNALDNILQADGSISVLAGGDGNDTYLQGSTGDDDLLVETATDGIDTVIAAHDYRLSDHIENLTLQDPQVPDFANFSLIPYAPYGPSWVRMAGYGNDLNNTIIGGRANNLLDGGLGADTLIGGAGDDFYIVDQGGDVVNELANEGIDTIESSVTYTLSANVEHLVLTGTGAADAIGNALNNDVRGNAASNILDGGAGDDSLQGNGGADTYLFGRGSGRDIVFDSSTTGEIETIQFAADVQTADVDVYRRSGDLVLIINGTTDELTLASFFGPTEYAQKQVRFTDGTVWNEAELRVRAVAVGGTVTGTEGDETLTGSAGHDVLIGAAGNDVLTGGLGNDVLYGDATSQSPFGPQVIGNDILTGGGGDDVLVDLRGTNTFDGGSGNDQLFVGTGQDTILFGRGSGIDSLTLDTNGSDLDIIQMGADVLPSEVILTRSIQRATGANIIDLTIPSTGDRLSINLSSVGSQSETSPQAAVLFADGTRWDLVWMPTESSSSGADLLDSPFPGTLAGLGGDDTYRMGSSGIPGTYAVVEAPGGGTDTVESLFDYVLDAQVEILIIAESFSSVLSNPERGTGNELDNLIVGNSGDNILDGGAGNDILVGGVMRELEGPPYLEGTGSDILLGGAGDDVLMADAGDLVSNGDWLFLSEGLTQRDVSVIREADDLFIGGTGNDTYIVHNQQQTVAEFANEGTDTVRSTVSYSLGEHLENLVLVSPPLRFDEETEMVIPPAPLNGTGNELDNVLIGSGDDNVLSGLEGRDTLWGGYAVESETGPAGSGDDTLIGGTGHDTYLFNIGDGIDTIEDVATVGDGNRIQFGAGISRSDLTFMEDTAARTLTIQVGTSGLDSLALTNFDPTGVNGSLVAETLVFADGSSASLANLLGPSITIMGTEDADVLVGTVENDGIDAGAGNDTVYAGAGDDLVLAGDGDDVVAGEAGIDTIHGGGGVDYLYGGDGDDLINGDEGADVLVGEAGNDIMMGGAGNDVLNGGLGDDSLSGGTGDDTVYAGAGNDQVSGGDGDDAAVGEEGADTMYGGSGNDYLYGGEGDDVVTGDEGNDTLLGEGGNDILNGGTGNDVLNGGAGADQFSGGEGDDSLYIDAADTVVVGGAGYDQVIVTGMDAVTFDAATAEVELVVGSSGDDVLTAVGSLSGVTFYGGDGNDQLTGGDGIDILIGEAGNDTLIGGAGNDVLNGGLGDDQLAGGVGDDTFYAGMGNDHIDGEDGSDSVSGEDGIDTIFGGAGADYLYGGEGDDVINGDEDNDVLVGEAGNDRLAGGAGLDYLVGGVGDDTYVFNVGDGGETISENDSASGNADALLFGSSITSLDVVISRQANDLRLAIHGTGDHVVIENWYLGDAYHVEDVQVGNGQHLLSSQVDQLIQAMASFSQQSGLTWDQAIDQRPQDVQTLLAASWQ